MLHTLFYTLGGIPLLYLGDEIAQPNDPTYTERLGAPPRHAHTSDTLVDPTQANTLEPYGLLILSPAAGDP